jgi:hypothetical protein
MPQRLVGGLTELLFGVEKVHFSTPSISAKHSLVKNAQRSKTVKVSSSALPKLEKTSERALTFDKSGILSKVYCPEVAKLAIQKHPKAQPKGAKCQKFTRERGTLTVLERWAFLPRVIRMRRGSR